MTDDEIRKAWVPINGMLPPAWAYEFARAIEQASRRAALEEAAKVCNEFALNFRDNLRFLTCEACANAIRALSKGETE